ncbi:MAG: patatin-like phospholipase family protein [Gemmatimonadaceae bacterium]
MTDSKSDAATLRAATAPTGSSADAEADAPGSPRLALVLGGGGLKGFAHIGVLQALEARGLRPSVYAGTSIGALIAAAHVSGVSVAEMAERATALRRRDLFRINHVGMVMERMQSPSLYLEAPLRELVRAVVPHRTFGELRAPLLVSTVDLEHGTQIVWGLPGLDDAWVDEAVYASCALPGFFPPGRVGGRICVDGGTVDNLPESFTRTLGVDAVIAVDVGSAEIARAHGAADMGFAAVFMRAATTMMNALQGRHLAQHDGPPMLLVWPSIFHLDWFTFGRAGEMIEEGRRAAEKAFDALDDVLAAPDGIYPRHAVRVTVNPALCIGCGICVAMAPDLMALDANRLAYARQELVNWSPADGDFVRHCPTRAILAHDAATGALTPSAEAPAPPALQRPRIRPRVRSAG